jgi:signal transduction histidine kinase
MKEAGPDDWGVLILGRDITERKLLESQLAQAQKLEGIGQLAAGIAHEINTPLQYVGDNARFLGECFVEISTALEAYARLLAAAEEGAIAPEVLGEAKSALEEADIEYLCEEVPRAIQQSLEGVERVTRIVRAMRDFSRPGVEEKTAIDINEAIVSTLTISRNEWKYVAEMETDFAADLPPVPCLAGELNQVILNLIINAAHAIAEAVGDGSGGKGTITIGTRCDGEWVEIRVRDTGTGIREKIRPRVFDPFFTTKEVGRGMGQGLSIAHSVIVDKHGGEIRFETETGKGTCFIIRLPLGPTQARATPTAVQEMADVEQGSSPVRG